jgi:hypothetical protein
MAAADTGLVERSMRLLQPRVCRCCGHDAQGFTGARNHVYNLTAMWSACGCFNHSSARCYGDAYDSAAGLALMRAANQTSWMCMPLFDRPPAMLRR